MINQQVSPASVTMAEIKFNNEKLTKIGQDDGSTK